MIILKDIQYRRGQPIQIKLPRPKMVIDPRPNDPRDGRFKCVYNENKTMATLTKTDYDANGLFQFRVYDPDKEDVPSFDSTIYTYLGVDGEMAPEDTTILIIDASVNIIRKWAFFKCEKIKQCFMHDKVRTIKDSAFDGCIAMKSIKLSRTLKRIGYRAFAQCKSLDALFLPPSIEKIGNLPFVECRNIRILPLPLNIDISNIGSEIVNNCNTFFEVTQIQSYKFLHEEGRFNTDDVHQSILDFYRDIPPLHKASLDVNANSQTIDEVIRKHGKSATFTTDHNGMTPLHILAMNPHVNEGPMMVCFQANMSAVFVCDRSGRTPLDYLREYENLKSQVSLIADLCTHWVRMQEEQGGKRKVTMEKHGRKRKSIA